MSKNTLIISRPAIGKTQKAIEYYIYKIQNGINGLYVSLEMKDTVLINRIMLTKMKLNVTLTTGGIKELFIDNIFSFSDIIKYISNIDENIKFVIVDYLQLINYDDKKNFNNEIDKFYEFCKEKNIDVILLSQLRRTMENKNSVWTEAVLELAIPDNLFLKHIDDGYFLTKAYGEIYCEDMQSIWNKIKRDTNEI
uniref:DnaB-like helicase C-terminal domain-containing protein n=1 Tax=Aliarcobacter sp. TaxID=2321116 RepID=UPI00404886D5